MVVDPIWNVDYPAPDGSYLVYARTIGPRITLMKVPAQGGDEQVLLPDRSGDYIQQHPVWSPDGRRFAFTANDGYRNLPAITQQFLRRAESGMPAHR